MKNTLPIRILFYILGLFLIALGTVVTTECGLGVASITCLAQALSLWSSISLGTVLAITYTIYVITQWIILKKDFKYKYLLEIAFAFVFGFFTDFISKFVHLSLTNIFVQVIAMLMGIVIIALGVCFMVNVDIVPNAPDGLVQVISIKLHKKFGFIKVIFDICHVIAALILSLFVLHNLGGFGATTIVSALLLGNIINVFNSLLEDKIHTLAFGKDSKYVKI